MKSPSNDLKEVGKLKRRITLYYLFQEELSKNGVYKTLLKCMTKERGDYILQQIHKAYYGSHIRGRAVVGKVMRVGFYWP